MERSDGGKINHFWEQKGEEEEKKLHLNGNVNSLIGCKNKHSHKFTHIPWKIIVYIYMYIVYISYTTSYLYPCMCINAYTRITPFMICYVCTSEGMLNLVEFNLI